MAKQTFTTGQVLTAAQMTSLQQTAMLGGSAAVKTTSYVLVASDAGTSVAMNSTSATTITVNTGLFAAGDTVTILNTNSGTCTITAGTATVSKPTNATLALVQNAGGVLYFTATGAATFFPFDVGSAPASSTKNFSLIGTANTTSGSTVTISGISNQDQLLIIFNDISTNAATAFYTLRFNSDSGANYSTYGANYSFGSTYNVNNYGDYAITGNTSTFIGQGGSNAASTLSGVMFVTGGATAGKKMYITNTAADSGGGNGQYGNHVGGFWDTSPTITSVSILCGAQTFDAGSISVYGSA